jgi:hypothetical protein
LLSTLRKPPTRAAIFRKPSIISKGLLAMFDLATVKLGKLPPKHDMRIPMLAHYTAALPPAPAAIDWSSGHTDDWGDMKNDVLGDCTCAGVGHAIQVFTLNAMNQRKTIPDATVIGLYEQFGYNPSDPSTDQGAVETDVLNYWLKNPVAGHAIEGYVGDRAEAYRRRERLDLAFGRRLYWACAAEIDPRAGHMDGAGIWP